MAWAYLVFAGTPEIVWDYAMKQSHGFTRIVPTSIMIGSFGALSLSMRTLSLGTAYMFSPGIWWSGLRLNRCGSFVHAWQMCS